MASEQTSGQCRLCGRTFGKRQMTTHIKSCWQKAIASVPEPTAAACFHLVIEGEYAPGFWLHLQASAKETFGDVDHVLRRIWLECCDHLSAFQFPVKRPPRGRGALTAALGGPAEVSRTMDEEDALMDESLGKKLAQGTLFSYQYDFGSTTKLSLRAAGIFSAPALEGAIKVLARNDPPAIACAVCKQPATQLCRDCRWQGQAAFCDACGRNHECGEEMLAPLINSPRAGVCGYDGPSVEP